MLILKFLNSSQLNFIIVILYSLMKKTYLLFESDVTFREIPFLKNLNIDLQSAKRFEYAHPIPSFSRTEELLFQAGFSETQTQCTIFPQPRTENLYTILH
ncbi:MAG: hypothetical protein EGP82_11680 [Odoribacter splanchnicus]|nr:hypothetical protein [Odoribacter splanchnicus]MBD9179813.1 hypothetical protein [Odoribacter splanchnicus]